MKPRLLILFLLVFSFACRKDKCEPEAEKPFADLPPAKDPTKSEKYRLKTRLIYANSSRPNPYTIVRYEYDVSGNLAKESSFDFPDVLSQYITYEHQDGDLKKKSIYVRQLDVLIPGGVSNYEYQNNKIIEREDLRGDGSLVRAQRYEYARNRLVNTYTADENRNYYHQLKYTYDSMGRVMKEENFTSNLLSSNYSFTYDDQSRISKKTLLTGSNQVLSYIEYVYEGNGKLPVKESQFDENGNLINILRRINNQDDYPTEVILEDEKGANTLEKNVYADGVIIDKKRFSAPWNFAESTYTRYEYERI